tara:strand:+ start:2177 stop:2824 length:648 start_codon:yes stop_codon:yes gene_type:complete
MLRKILAISIFIFYVAYAAETTALSEKKWALEFGSQGIEFGGTLPISETQSVFASVGWLDITFNDVPIVPIPFFDVTGFRWVVAKKLRIKSSSFSLGYRWFHESNVVQESRFLFIPPKTQFKEAYWTFLVKTQTILNETDTRFFDAFDIDGLQSEKSFVTPAFGLTNVYRKYNDGEIGNIEFVTKTLIGFNMNTDGQRMYPMPQINFLYSSGFYF